MNTQFKDVISKLQKQSDEKILESLGDLVRAGVLVVKRTEPVVVEEYGYLHKYSLQQEVKFELRDQEYIDSLKKENAELKVKLQRIEGVLNEKQSN